MEDIYTKTYAKNLDSQDELRAFRNEFYLKNECVYMDGNSLGLMSKRAEQSVYDLLASWREYGIDGWTEGNQPGITYLNHLAEKWLVLLVLKRRKLLLLARPR